MADYILTILDEKKDHFELNVCNQGKYKTEIQDGIDEETKEPIMIPNPETRKEFFEKMLLKYAQNAYEAGIIDAAVEIERVAARVIAKTKIVDLTVKEKV